MGKSPLCSLIKVQRAYFDDLSNAGTEFGVGMATPEESKPSPPEQTQVQQPTKTALADDDEKIPHYTFELYRHTILRGANVASLAVLMFGPVVLLFRGVRRPTEMVRRLAAASPKAVVSRVCTQTTLPSSHCTWHTHTNPPTHANSSRTFYPFSY